MIREVQGYDTKTRSSMNTAALSNEIGNKFERAMVTGGAGFIGSHIIESLLDTGIEVISVDDFAAGKKENIAPFLSNPRFTSAKCDVTDYDSLKKCFDGVDVVFHEASRSSRQWCWRFQYS